MNILLVYPQYIHHSSFDARSPSLSILYLASNLEKDGERVKIFDASTGPVRAVDGGFLYGISNDEVEARLKDEDFDLVGITCSFASRWRYAAGLAGTFKRMKPGVPVAVGGLFPTYEWEFCFSQSPDIDMIILGEGEESFAKVVRNLKGGASINDACAGVDGVAWRDGKGIRKNDKTSFIEDLDSLSFPAWHLLDLKETFSCQKNWYELRPPYFTVLSSRGCPEACTFCNMYITHARKWRARSTENFVDELGFLKKKYGVSRFFIADDNFSFNIDRAKGICNEILRRGIKVRYNTGNGLNINRIDKELLGLMKASGCGSVALAIESGSERMRNGVYRKRLSTDKICQAVEWCNELKLPVVGFFMVGAPGENRESVDETKRLIKKLPLTLCTCSIYTPYPGTALFNECREKGYLKTISPGDKGRVEFATCMVNTPDFSSEDVKAWQREIYLYFLKTKWLKLLRQLVKPGGIVTFSQLPGIRRFFKAVPHE